MEPQLWEPRQSWVCGLWGTRGLNSLLPGTEARGKTREGFPFLFPMLRTLSPETHLLPEMGGEGGRRGQEPGSLRCWVWGERAGPRVHPHPALWRADPLPLPGGMGDGGGVLGLPCSLANSPGLATALFAFCSFLKLPFKRFLADAPCISPMLKRCSK